ncbi:putative c6 transcription factor protein [Zalerion maritima]|uniref:C6 transcription factor protein n=1 Tax=Zalerion maritima TaxID=339359 RepID=A0AAD5RJ77_9PEZI|nr:putative c6 transcription factor protein [Zalerion maritima]
MTQRYGFTYPVHRLLLDGAPAARSQRSHSTEYRKGPPTTPHPMTMLPTTGHIQPSIAGISCDGEFPCKRCKDDGLVCTAGTRKKTEYKQLPRGYAEVLENTQFALIATVHKLYAMVRNGQSWDLGEPELNDRGQPVIHNIASKLGCIRPQNDLDLPVGNIFPEDEAGLSELVATLEAHQRERDSMTAPSAPTSKASPPSTVSSPASHHEPKPQHTDRASSSELDHSDLETDYRRAVFGRMNEPSSATCNKGTPSTASTMPPTLSPQSLNYDFDVSSAASDIDTVSVAASTLFPGASPSIGSFPPAPTWNSRPVSMEFTPDQLVQLQAGNQAANSMMDVDDLLNQGLLESEFGRLKPHIMNCPNPEVMMGMGDPMIFGGGGYEGETLRM